MKCLKATTLISLATAASALMAVSASAAIIAQDNSAANCVYSSGAVPKVSGNGNFYNSSTTASSVVICPVNWDAQTIELGFAGVVAVVSDKSTAGGVSCQLARVTEDGATVVLGTASATSGSTTTGARLALAMPSGSGGNFFVKCTLGKKGGFSPAINGYEVYSGDPAP
jgi:hypothetical protein